jgi:DNA-binding LacI/PurR family transcriptional regulator
LHAIASHLRFAVSYAFGELIWLRHASPVYEVTPARFSCCWKATGRSGRVAGRHSLSNNSKITSYHVAALAGVSRSAVSRAFTPGASISEKTKQRVLAAAAKLGYQPNVIARSLTMQKSHLIGVVMGDWANPFFSMMLKLFSEKLQARGYQVILAVVSGDEDTDDAIRLLMQYQVDGVITVSVLPSAMIAADCLQKQTPIVLLNREPSGISASSVTCDAGDVGRKIARTLLDAGYARFALLRGDSDLEAGIQETEAIQQTIEDRGSARIVAQEAHIVSYDAGREAIGRLMKKRTKPDAIICSSDLTARGVLDGALIDLKIDVPEQLGIFGFGDSPAATWGANRLTTIRLPIEEEIDASIDVLIERLADPDLGPTNIVTVAEVIRRSTVRKMPDQKKKLADQL